MRSNSVDSLVPSFWYQAWRAHDEKNLQNIVFHRHEPEVCSRRWRASYRVSLIQTREKAASVGCQCHYRGGRSLGIASKYGFYWPSSPHVEKRRSRKICPTYWGKATVQYDSQFMDCYAIMGSQPSICCKWFVCLFPENCALWQNMH